MSLEAQLEKLTASVDALTAAVIANGAPAVSSGPAKAPAVEIRRPPIDRPPKSEAAKAEAPDALPTPEEVKEAVVRLIQKRGRDVAVELLASVGATKATDIKEEFRAQFVADAKTMIAA